MEGEGHFRREPQEEGGPRIWRWQGVFRESQSAVSPGGGLEVLLRRKAEKVSELRKCLTVSHYFFLSGDQKPLNTIRQFFKKT